MVKAKNDARPIFCSNFKP